MNPAHSLVREHVRAGGHAMVLEQGMNGDMITLYDNGTHTPLLWTYLIPATMEGKATHNVQNAMFAAAMAYGLGKSLDDIRHVHRNHWESCVRTRNSGHRSRICLCGRP